jgi:hypothetical protein
MAQWCSPAIHDIVTYLVTSHEIWIANCIHATRSCKQFNVFTIPENEAKLHGLSPRANYTDRATADIIPDEVNF